MGIKKRKIRVDETVVNSTVSFDMVALIHPAVKT
jgi:hypothetical protein